MPKKVIYRAPMITILMKQNETKMLMAKEMLTAISIARFARRSWAHESTTNYTWRRHIKLLWDILAEFATSLMRWTKVKEILAFTGSFDLYWIYKKFIPNNISFHTFWYTYLFLLKALTMSGRINLLKCLY